MLRRVFAIVAYLTGITGAAMFMFYVLASGTGFVARDESASDGADPWLNNLFWILLFAAQHSGMARQSYKNFVFRLIPVSLERSLYVLMSGLTLASLTLFWQPLPGEPVWHGPIGIVGFSLLAMLGVGACSAWFDHAAFFGLTQAWTGAAESPVPLQIHGPYRYVRHPLMLGLLIAIWAQPIMPPELLMLNAGMTLYIVLAICLEERDLVRIYGAEYEKYRRDVPALIPFLFSISVRAAARLRLHYFGSEPEA